MTRRKSWSEKEAIFYTVVTPRLGFFGPSAWGWGGKKKHGREIWRGITKLKRKVKVQGMGRGVELLATRCKGFGGKNIL